MFKGHPKGLFILALTNMGERFGYYTMLAIFVLYLQAKFGLDSGKTGQIFGGFLAAVYFLPLLGGIIADRFLGYGKTIFVGILIMFGGYALLATPSESDTMGYVLMFGALGLISLGTGFFKGNLHALVGNLYDENKYKLKRDVAFSIFYMFINIGAFFAPTAAEAVSNRFLSNDGFTYEAEVPEKALKYLNFNTQDSATFANAIILENELQEKPVLKQRKEIMKAKKKQGVIFEDEKVAYKQRLDEIGKEQLGTAYMDVDSFSKNYVESLSKSYNWGFALACGSLIISLMIFIGFRKTYKNADFTEKQKAADKTRQHEVKTLTPEQTKERLIALGLVFAVVIFFWMSFHQNGLSMTFFARDYTNLDLTPIQFLTFSLGSLLLMIVGFYGVWNIFQSKEMRGKITGGAVAALAIVGIIAYYKGVILNDPEIAADGIISITPPKFQQFNPFFIIILTPVFIALFTWLNKIGKEPSAPKKIGIGMLLAAFGFVALVLPSLGLQSPQELQGSVSPSLVSANWLIGTYFMLTISELFLSPMGISFVSKVAPPQYKGLMQGGWLAATAVGNYLVGVVGGLWDSIPLALFWGILITCCLLSGIFIFSILKRLERATNNA